LKAASRLRAADLVLHDALVDPAALGLAPHARFLYVGKRARKKSISQSTIERLLVRAARRGDGSCA
jgi:uroporphyrin-III C-methyltransferase